MNRSARVRSAVSWLKRFSGKNLIRGYCKHYGVDWRCAAIELAQLGIDIDPEYLKQREATDEQLANSRKKRREAQAGEEMPERWYEYDSALEAYLVEDYAALHAMECERNPHGDDGQQKAS